MSVTTHFVTVLTLSLIRPASSMAFSLASPTPSAASFCNDFSLPPQLWDIRFYDKYLGQIEDLLPIIHKPIPLGKLCRGVDDVTSKEQVILWCDSQGITRKSGRVYSQGSSHTAGYTEKENSKSVD
jgi:hypothetical protein